MRLSHETLTPSLQARTTTSVNFAGPKSKAKVPADKLPFINRIIPKVTELKQARERGATLTDYTGRNISRTDLGDYFDHRGKIKKPENIAHGKSRTDLESRLQWLEGMRIKEKTPPPRIEQIRATPQGPTITKSQQHTVDSDNIDILNNFAQAHFRLGKGKTPDRERAYAEASAKVRQLYNLPPGAIIQIGDNKFAELI